MCRSLDQGANQILRTVICAVINPGGECSSGVCSRERGTVCACVKTGASQEITKRETSVEGAEAASCGCSSVRTSVRQQPIFVMSAQLPCMERQQALSSWFIALPVIQASKGAADESRMKIAMKLAMRRILLQVYVFFLSDPSLHGIRSAHRLTSGAETPKLAIPSIARRLLQERLGRRTY